MHPKILVCHSNACTGNHSPDLLRDLEDMVQGQCVLEEVPCLHRCSKGPNVELQWKDGETRIEGLTSFQEVLHLVQDDLKFKVPDVVRRAARITYDVRRDDDHQSKMRLLQQAIDQVGPEAKLTSDTQRRV